MSQLAVTIPHITLSVSQPCKAYLKLTFKKTEFVTSVFPSKLEDSPCTVHAWSLPTLTFQTSEAEAEKEHYRVELWQKWNWPWNDTLLATSVYPIASLLKNHCTLPASDPRRRHQAVTIHMQLAIEDAAKAPKIEMHFFPEVAGAAHWRGLFSHHTTKINALLDLLYLLERGKAKQSAKDEKWAHYCSQETLELLVELLRQWATGSLPKANPQVDAYASAKGIPSPPPPPASNTRKPVQTPDSDSESSDEEDDDCSENKVIMEDDDALNPIVNATCEAPTIDSIALSTDVARRRRDAHQIFANTVVKVWRMLITIDSVRTKLGQMGFPLMLLGNLEDAYTRHPRHALFLLELLHPYFGTSSAGVTSRMILPFCLVLESFVNLYIKRISSSPDGTNSPSSESCETSSQEDLEKSKSDVTPLLSATDSNLDFASPSSSSSASKPQTSSVSTSTSSMTTSSMDDEDIKLRSSDTDSVFGLSVNQDATSAGPMPPRGKAEPREMTPEQRERQARRLQRRETRASKLINAWHVWDQSLRQRSLLRIVTTLFQQLKYFDPSYVPIIIKKTRLLQSVYFVFSCRSAPSSLADLCMDTLTYIGPSHLDALVMTDCLPALKSFANESKDFALRLKALDTLHSLTAHLASTKVAESDILELFLSGMSTASDDPMRFSLNQRFFKYLYESSPTRLAYALQYPSTIELLLSYNISDNQTAAIATRKMLPQHIPPQPLIFAHFDAFFLQHLRTCIHRAIHPVGDHSKEYQNDRMKLTLLTTYLVDDIMAAHVYDSEHPTISEELPTEALLAYQQQPTRQETGLTALANLPPNWIEWSSAKVFFLKKLVPDLWTSIWTSPGSLVSLEPQITRIWIALCQAQRPLFDYLVCEHELLAKMTTLLESILLRNYRDYAAALPSLVGALLQAIQRSWEYGLITFACELPKDEQGQRIQKTLRDLLPLQSAFALADEPLVCPIVDKALAERIYKIVGSLLRQSGTSWAILQHIKWERMAFLTRFALIYNLGSVSADLNEALTLLTKGHVTINYAYDDMVPVLIQALDIQITDDLKDTRRLIVFESLFNLTLNTVCPNPSKDFIYTLAYVEQKSPLPADDPDFEAYKQYEEEERKHSKNPIPMPPRLFVFLGRVIMKLVEVLQNCYPKDNYTHVALTSGVAKFTSALAAKDRLFRDRILSMPSFWQLYQDNVKYEKDLTRSLASLFFENLNHPFIKEHVANPSYLPLWSALLQKFLLSGRPLLGGGSVASRDISAAALEGVYDLVSRWLNDRLCRDQIDDVTLLAKKTLELSPANSELSNKFVKLWISQMAPLVEPLGLNRAIDFLSMLNHSSSLEFDQFAFRIYVAKYEQMRKAYTALPFELSVQTLFQREPTTFTSAFLNTWTFFWRHGSPPEHLKQAFNANNFSIAPLQTRIGRKYETLLEKNLQYESNPKCCFEFLDPLPAEPTYGSPESDKHVLEYRARLFRMAELVAVVCHEHRSAPREYNAGTNPRHWMPPLPLSVLNPKNWGVNDPLQKLLICAFQSWNKRPGLESVALKAQSKQYASIIVEEVVKRAPQLMAEAPIVILAILQSGVLHSHLEFEFLLYPYLFELFQHRFPERARAAAIVRDMAKVAARHPEQFCEAVPFMDVIQRSLPSASPVLEEAALCLITIIAHTAVFKTVFSKNEKFREFLLHRAAGIFDGDKYNGNVRVLYALLPLVKELPRLLGDLGLRTLFRGIGLVFTKHMSPTHTAQQLFLNTITSTQAFNELIGQEEVNQLQRNLDVLLRGLPFFVHLFARYRTTEVLPNLVLACKGHDAFGAVSNGAFIGRLMLLFSKLSSEQKIAVIALGAGPGESSFPMAILNGVIDWQRYHKFSGLLELGLAFLNFQPEALQVLGDKEWKAVVTRYFELTLDASQHHPLLEHLSANLLNAPAYAMPHDEKSFVRSFPIPAALFPLKFTSIGGEFVLAKYNCLHVSVVDRPIHVILEDVCDPVSMHTQGREGFVLKGTIDPPAICPPVIRVGFATREALALLERNPELFLGQVPGSYGIENSGSSIFANGSIIAAEHQRTLLSRRYFSLTLNIREQIIVAQYNSSPGEISDPPYVIWNVDLSKSLYPVISFESTGSLVADQEYLQRKTLSRDEGIWGLSKDAQPKMSVPKSQPTGHIWDLESIGLPNPTPAPPMPVTSISSPSSLSRVKKSSLFDEEDETVAAVSSRYTATARKSNMFIDVNEDWDFDHPLTPAASRTQATPSTQATSSTQADTLGVNAFLEPARADIPNPPPPPPAQRTTDDELREIQRIIEQQDVLLDQIAAPPPIPVDRHAFIDELLPPLRQDLLHDELMHDIIGARAIPRRNFLQRML